MKSLFLTKLLSLVLVTGMITAGCGAAEQAAAPKTDLKPSTESSLPGKEVSLQQPKLKVVTSFYPLYEFTRHVAGDKAEVVNLIPGGVEPHDWEPTAQDMKMIQEARVFVYNGAGLESWADKVLSSFNKEKTTVVEASKNMELIEGMEHDEDDHDHDHGKEAGDKHSGGNEQAPADPHVWLDPVLAQKEVESIQAALELADPANKEAYKTNAAAYIAKLQELDKSFKDGLASVKRKEFVTQHAAFGYMAKRYGLTQVPIAGLSPEQEPTPSKMADIIKFAKEKQVKTIFFETLVNPKVAETVAKELGAKTAVLNPIEGLTDEDKAKNLDYIGIMSNNLAALMATLSE
ncbi:metal ABC transporter substrate-binding protein [Paenibacillus sp. UNC451MF]|uniref:metal ABC transporter substrate-binding protein n=1 Tax=Paenibacillus sp. UNC451MF TaxID=1449063 RepID=UPI000490A857